jgi:hypothetical protein
MKTTYLVATAAISAVLAAPVTAHHNSPIYDLIEIGDMMGNHDDAIDNLDQPGGGDMTSSMDPADDMSDGGMQMPDDLDPQPSGTHIPDELPDGGVDNGGTGEREPW